MPAEGRDHHRTESRFSQPPTEEMWMTVQKKPSTVTTGPIAGWIKIHSSPEGRPDIAVPFRQIALDPSTAEPPFRAYDTSGPYTDPAVTIDLEAGLPPLRRPWIDRRGFGRVA